MQLGCSGFAAADKKLTERFTKEMADTVLLLDSGKLKFKDWPIPNINSVYAKRLMEDGVMNNDEEKLLRAIKRAKISLVDKQKTYSFETLFKHGGATPLLIAEDYYLIAKTSEYLNRFRPNDHSLLKDAMDNIELAFKSMKQAETESKNSGDDITRYKKFNRMMIDYHIVYAALNLKKFDKTNDEKYLLLAMKNITQNLKIKFLKEVFPLGTLKLHRMNANILLKLAHKYRTNGSLNKAINAIKNYNLEIAYFEKSLTYQSITNKKTRKLYKRQSLIYNKKYNQSIEKLRKRIENMADTIPLLDSGKLKFKDWPVPNINSVYAKRLMKDGIRNDDEEKLLHAIKRAGISLVDKQKTYKRASLDLHNYTGYYHLIAEDYYLIARTSEYLYRLRTKDHYLLQNAID